MAGTQRVYKQKIRATATLEKVFRAMELISASRIGKAKDKAMGQDPYTRALTNSIAMVAAHADEDHPLVSERTDTKRVIVFVVTSDRGMAGAYSASILREANSLLTELKNEGKEPLLFVSGRRGVTYFNFRGIPMEQSWTGESDSPSVDTSAEISKIFLDLFLAPTDAGGVGEIYVVSTKFVSMVSQVVQIRRLLPLEIIDAEHAGDAEHDEQAPLYEFEPNPKAVFDTLLPLYISQRIYSLLLMSAAAELVARQQAMHSATENAGELIEKYTRLANNARQAEITTEITEIISGAEALGK